MSNEATFVTLTPEQASRLGRMLMRAAIRGLEVERDNGTEFRGLVMMTVSDAESEVNVMLDDESFDRSVTGLDIDRY